MKLLSVVLLGVCFSVSGVLFGTGGSAATLIDTLDTDLSESPCQFIGDANNADCQSIEQTGGTIVDGGV